MPEKVRILVVDDTPSNIKILASILQDEYSVSIATNGQDCLDLVLNQQPPHLILLDIMMPGMDGYEVCRRLKEDKKTRDIPIIFVTDMTEVENETRGLEMGAVDYITKPISPPIVLARVKNHLLLKKQHDALKESISLMEHEAEILQQKAELGIQAGGLAHDINNILAACLIVEMIPDMIPGDSPRKGEINEFVDIAVESVHLGTEVCRGYTSYLRDIGSEARVQPVLPLLQPIDMYSRKFRGDLKKDFADNLPDIHCKGYQIKRVLVNLFSNASQAIDNQREQVIEVKVWSADGMVHFSVKDNGQGIPDDVLPNIFKERFTTKETGTGLGLFMVKEIIDNHQGIIEVDTKAGEGTVFTISLPIAEN